MHILLIFKNLQDILSVKSMGLKHLWFAIFLCKKEEKIKISL